MRIDAHCHVWGNAPEKYPWKPIGGYIPEVEASPVELLERMDAAGIDRAVLVQPTPYGWDNTYLLDAARTYPDRFKVTCLVDPCAPDSPERLARLVEDRGARGVRFNWNLNAGYAWAEDALHERVWSAAQDLGIPVCLQMVATQAPQVKEMAGRFPRLKIVLDHLGRPAPGVVPGDPSFHPFLELANWPNCSIKLSGLYYFSKLAAPFEDAWPLVKTAARAYGAQRCLWGSDFPFVLDRWSYTGWLESLRSKLEFSTGELDWVLGRTAAGLGW